MMQKPSPKIARAKALFAQATAHHQAGRLREAEGLYKQVLMIDAEQIDTLRLLGGLYVQAGQLELGVDFLQRAAKLQPDNPEIFGNLGIAYRVLDHLSDAIASLETAVRLNPQNTKNVHGLANALRDAGREAHALQAYQHALGLQKPDAVLLQDIGLTHHRIHQYEEATQFYRQSLRVQPQISTLINLGSALRELERTQEALETFQQALMMAPEKPEIHVNLAATHWDRYELEQSRISYERALELRPDHPEALINLGTVYWALGDTLHARATYEKVLELTPTNADAITNIGALLQDQGKADEAFVYYQRALGLDPGNVNALWRSGLVLLERGEYADGWARYESGLGRKDMRGIMHFRQPKWDGQPIPGQRLLIWSEQGFGDSLQFIRYAVTAKERAQAAKVIVLCPRALIKLFSQIPGIDEVCEAIENIDFDQQISIMSLPNAFRTTLETIPTTIPYLFVDQATRDLWDERLANLPKNFKVGLIWAGNARERLVNASLMDRRRSLHLRKLAPLLDIPGVAIVNLQMGPPAAQIDELGLRDRVIDPMGEVKDFMDTAAIMQHLDLIITVDTSVAHLAGGLGKPVWILSRYDACWRWLKNRPDSPWYPTARIFGQPNFGDWDSVIAAVREALEKTVPAPTQSP